jgi:CDP-glucose 4,6-dehydratase
MEGLVTLSGWRDRRVLVTGHTGFKGAWLTDLLDELGAEVHGLALEPPTVPSLWDALGRRNPADAHVDFRDASSVRARIEAVRPDVVLHLAAQGLVPEAMRDPVGTFATNVLGTAHVLDAAYRARVPATLVVTSDKVYAPSPEAHAEGDPLGGDEPYAGSKVACEFVVRGVRGAFFAPEGLGLATARAGNVIGGGDFAPARIVPDVVRAIAADAPVALRQPAAVRPWQHVLDPLRGYLLLADRLLASPDRVPEAVNFGPPPDEDCSVAELMDRLASAWGREIPWVIMPRSDLPETITLRVDSALAADELGWHALLSLDETVAWTVGWYRAASDGADVAALTRGQVRDFLERAETAA